MDDLAIRGCRSPPQQKKNSLFKRRHGAFTVTFYQTQIGLIFEPDLQNQVIVIKKIEKGSEAAIISNPELQVGMVLSSLNKQRAKKLKIEKVLKMLRVEQRPLKLGFRYPRPKELQAQANGLKQVLSGVLPIIVPRSVPLCDYIQPRKNGRGAVVSEELLVPFNGNESDSHDGSNISIDSNDIHLRKGTVIKKIDDLDVTELPIEHIINILLQESIEPWSLLFERKEHNLRSLSSSSSKLESRAGSMDSLKDEDTDEISLLDDYTNIRVSGKNAEWALQHIELLIENERIISAGNLIDKLEHFLDHKVEVPCSVKQTLRRRIADPNFSVDFTLIKDRRDAAIQALRDFNSEDESGWIFAQSYFGVETYYKPDPDGTIWLKLEGSCEDIEVFHSLAVVRESDLYNNWAPFCNKAELLKYIGRVEIVTYLNVAIPLMQRDIVIHAFGVNATYEYGCVVILGNSVDSWPDTKIPPVSGWNSDRMDIRGFRALVEPRSRRSARTSIVANIDPKCPIPQSLINFATKKMAGVLLYFLLKEAAKISQDPEKNVYAKRIREDPFYEWLKPRMNIFFKKQDSDTLPERLPLVGQQLSEADHAAVVETPQAKTHSLSPSPKHVVSTKDTINSFELEIGALRRQNRQLKRLLLIMSLLLLFSLSVLAYVGWTLVPDSNPFQILIDRIPINLDPSS